MRRIDILKTVIPKWIFEWFPLAFLPVTFILAVLLLHPTTPGRKTIPSQISKSTSYTRITWNQQNYHQCETVGPSQRVIQGANASFGSHKTCSFKLLKKHFKDHHSLPGDGLWCKNRNSGDVNPEFIPQMCKFPYTEMPAEVVSQCLASGRIRRIVTMGDSQGGLHHAAMFGVLSKAMDSCEIIKAEHNGRLERCLDPQYLAGENWTDMKQEKVPKSVEEYGCRSCIGLMRLCRYTAGETTHTLLLEHLRLCKRHQNSTYLQYLFTNYLQKGTPVDYIIFVPPLTHYKTHRPRVTKGLVRTIRDNVLKHLPKTNLVWFTSPREVRETKSDSWKDRLFFGLTANKKLEQLNKVTFKELYDKMRKRKSRVHGFWDMFVISRDEWSTDGVHYYPIWYTRMQQQLLQLICLSDYKI